MQAYKQIITKTEFVAELKKHQKADNFIRGYYWSAKDRKGCAVGCSLESISRLKKIQFKFSDHSLYPIHLGIPEWLACVEDRIFENIRIDRSKTWPVEFAEAIHTGADLDQIKGPFLIMVLESALTSFDHKKFPDVKKVVDRSIALWKRDDIGSPSWNKAAGAARWAAGAARWAAGAARWAADADAAADAAAGADADAAADAARWAADAARWAADAAAAAGAARWAAAAAAAADADAAARTNKMEYFADELLKLLKNCE